MKRMRTAWFSCALAASLVGGCGGATGATLDTAASGAVSSGGAAGWHAGATSLAGSPSAGGSGNHSGGDNSNVAGTPSDTCAVADLDGLSVFSGDTWDPLGYPPYALERCTLVYVAPANGGGALHLRNLATGEDSELEPAESHARRPSLAGGVIAWEVGDFAQSQVRVRYEGTTQTLSGAFDHAGEPRVAPDAVVFTAFLGPNPTDDTDVYLYRVATEQLTGVAVGPGQQRFADVSRTHVAVTDFSEDPRGYFDQFDSIADVVTIDRDSDVATPRKRAGKQAFPLLTDQGALAYLDWGAVHPEPKFSQFGLRLGQLGAPVDADIDVTPEPIHTDPAYVRPSLHGSHLDFVDTRTGVIGLYSFTLASGEPATLTPIAGSPQLFGPVATDAMTLISRPLQGQTLALTAVAR